MASTFPTLAGPSALGSPGGPPFGPASVQFGFEVPTGSPGELEALASGMRNAGGWFRDQLARVRASGQVAVDAAGGWSGQAASAFSALTGRLAQTLSDNDLACEEAATALGQLSRALSHAQQVTRQALADCEQLHGQLVSQQGAAAEASSRAAALEQQASNPLQHPAAIQQLQHQASLARGDQTTAQNAANQTQAALKQAQQRGHDAYVQYQTEAHGLSARIQAAAGGLRPVDQVAGRAAASLLGIPGGSAMAGVGIAPAVIGNPFVTSPFDAYQPGSLLSLVQESRYRTYVRDAVDGSVAGASTYASERAAIIRQQLSANARQIIQLDERIAAAGPNTPDGLMLSALRSATAGESSSLYGAARTLGGRAAFLDAAVAPTLLGVSFFANVAEGQNVAQAATGTTFSFSGAWLAMRGAAALCPVRTPLGEGACAAVGAVVGGIGGEAAANQLTSAENAVNQQLKQSWKDVSQPIGGGGLLSGMSPLMAVNP